MDDSEHLGSISDFEDEKEKNESISFENMNLDMKLLYAIADVGWKKPTLIQEKTIPLALEGHDILARARTGTGKTGAFVIPILHKLLSNKNCSKKQVKALILVPSKELCNQAAKSFHDLTKYCRRDVTIVDIGQGSLQDKRDFLMSEKPDILISTPRKIIEYLTSKTIDLSYLNFLVIDESDLMFSFGYQEDLMKILEYVPKNGLQHFLMSATLNTDVKELKKLVLTNPVILKLEEPDLPESDRLLQYHIEVFDEEEKFVLINALFKLGLILGKSIIFVKDVDRCYQLKLFLEQFGIRTCVLNSELPIASRCYVVEQFNSGVYDIIIANDEKCINDPRTREMAPRKKKSNINAESGVSRGIDFKFVSNIINFDFPTSVDSYIHRVGRTARGNEDADGTVLSFVASTNEEDKKYFRKVLKRFSQKGDNNNDNSNFKPYQFKMSELEAFRYRARDALRAVTTISIKEARLKEIRREMLASKTLKSFFKEHPKDHKVLKFDRPLHVVKHKAHLQDVPEYIVPQTLQTVVRSKRENKRIEEAASLSYEPKRKKKRIRMPAPQHSTKASNDPLKTFKIRNNKRKAPNKRKRMAKRQ